MELLYPSELFKDSKLPLLGLSRQPLLLFLLIELKGVNLIVQEVLGLLFNGWKLVNVVIIAVVALLREFSMAVFKRACNASSFGMGTPNSG